MMRAVDGPIIERDHHSLVDDRLSFLYLADKGFTHRNNSSRKFRIVPRISTWPQQSLCPPQLFIAELSSSVQWYCESPSRVSARGFKASYRAFHAMRSSSIRMTEDSRESA